MAGGKAAEFIEMNDVAADSIAMGNGGNDVYQVDDSGDKGVINELGNLMDRVAGAYTGSSDDTVQFELASDMFDIDFTRGNIAGEATDSTLFIASEAGVNAGEATLFDQYNDFLPFRQTEYVMIGDGATADEIFEIADGTDIAGWKMRSMLMMPVTTLSQRTVVSTMSSLVGVTTPNIGTLADGDSVTVTMSTPMIL